ncbi:MAG: type II/IV secretion system protein [Planctomycetota bacterium]|nr:type II/IV secretion system protein [Planctomycetota bacterium]
MHLDDLRRASLPDLARHIQGVTSKDAFRISEVCDILLKKAVLARVSDVHIEPTLRGSRVRYRIDGVFQDAAYLPVELHEQLVSRVKVLADLLSHRREIVQEGRISLEAGEGRTDLRVSVVPTVGGEKVVARIFSTEASLFRLEQIGYDPAMQRRIRNIIFDLEGLFLLTGPSGSGKTTTLYAALKKLNKPDVKIITAENPVEYNLEGINQAEVNHEIGRTFSVILKAMLRQAPNVILVGEIRDEETATVGIQAALTGHLVFSTLHTNDAPSSISRLTDMGVKPFLVASAVLAILAQRLLRRLCPKCKEPIEIRDLPDWQLASVGLKPEQVRGKQLFGPVGCDNCNGSGYRGRLGVYELLEMGPQVRELAFNEAHTTDIRKAAIQNGMTTLQVDGVRKVLDGLTTIDEVLVITHRQDLKLA